MAALSQGLSKKATTRSRGDAWRGDVAAPQAGGRIAGENLQKYREPL